MRLRHLVTIGPRPPIGTELHPDADVTFVPMEAIADGLGGLDISQTRPFSEVVSGSYNYFAEGDLLLAKVTPCFENGKKALVQSLSNGIGYATSEVHVIRPGVDRIHPKYLFYLLCSEDFRAGGIASMTGAGGLRRVSDAAVLNYQPSVTNLPTQKAIADFLDRETARIDQLIEKKRRMVEVLEEKERAVISEGFAALGAEKWRVRHLGRLRNGAGFPVDLQGDPTQEIAFFKVKHLRTHGLDAYIVDTDDTVSKATAKALQATVFPARTIVFAKIGAALLLGRFSMIGRAACLDNNMAAFIPNERLINPSYTMLALSQIDMTTMVQPGAVPSLSTEAFYKYMVQLPQQVVQVSFVNDVRSRRTMIGKTIAKAAASIDRLREFRSALITAAVTGQIDVSTWGKQGTSDRRLDRIKEATST